MHLLRSFAHPNTSLIRLSLATLLACAIAVVAAETPRADQDMQNFDCVIYVKDSQVMKGPLQEPISIDFEAVSSSGAIQGEYTGSATMTFGKNLDEVSAQVVSTSTHLYSAWPPFIRGGATRPPRIRNPNIPARAR